MNDALLVRDGEGLGERGGDRHQALDRHPALGDDPVERLPLHQLHRQEVDPVRLLDGVDADDSRVIERGERLRFTPEAFEPLRARRHLRRQQLERHVAPELRVGGAVDLAHPARTDRGGDAVVGQAATDQGVSSFRASPLIGLGRAGPILVPVPPVPRQPDNKLAG